MPTFLLSELEWTVFDITQFNNKIEIAELAINDYQRGDINPVPLFYQSGYLTITGYDKKALGYTGWDFQTRK
jgi:hypothetical protein